MISKLVVRNVRRNIKSYSVYFTTLTLIYGLLYSFNAVVDNPILDTASDTKRVLSRFMEQFMGVFSIIVAMGFVFLVLYTTQFILKRRSKELGLYSSLGMKSKQINRILFLENSIVNLVAVIFGLILGWILSIGMTKVLIKIFYLTGKVDIFLISKKSILITLSCFLIIVSISAIFNMFRLKKISITSLLLEETSYDKYINRNNKVDIIIMLISIVFLLISVYVLNSSKDIAELKDKSYIIIGFLVIGTIGFYNSLGNSMTRILKNFPKLYYKSSNSILIRELSSESKKNSLTLALLSIFLTLSFSIVLIGGSSYSSMNKMVQESSPYNLTIVSKKKEILKELEKNNIQPKENFKKYLEFNLFESSIKYSDIGLVNSKDLWKIDQGLENMNVPIIKLSDYNKVLKLQGKDEIKIYDNEYVINCNYKGTLESIEKFLNGKAMININNIKLKKGSSSPLSNTIIMTSVGNNDRGTIVVPDFIVEDLKEQNTAFNAIYKSGVNEMELTSKMNDWVMQNSRNDGSGLKFDYKYQTKDRLTDMFVGFMGAIVFLTMFVGIIFSIITLCILSIQTTTSAINFKKNAIILSSLGLKKGKISNIILFEDIIYFLTPCIISIPGGIIFGIKVMDFFESFLNFHIEINPLVLIVQTTLFLTYISLTFRLSRRIVREDMLT